MRRTLSLATSCLIVGLAAACITTKTAAAPLPAIGISSVSDLDVLADRDGFVQINQEDDRERARNRKQAKKRERNSRKLAEKCRRRGCNEDDRERLRNSRQSSASGTFREIFKRLKDGWDNWERGRAERDRMNREIARSKRETRERQRRRETAPYEHVGSGRR